MRARAAVIRTFHRSGLGLFNATLSGIMVKGGAVRFLLYFKDVRGLFTTVLLTVLTLSLDAVSRELQQLTQCVLSQM